jgi:hypothetical protein
MSPQQIKGRGSVATPHRPCVRAVRGYQTGLLADEPILWTRQSNDLRDASNCQAPFRIPATWPEPRRRPSCVPFITFFPCAGRYRPALGDSAGRPRSISDG